MYRAEVLADSVGPHGIRLTTLEVTFPRTYLAEFNTHRMFSRNSESSRAIPTEKLIERARDNPYIPEFGARVKGMGTGAPLEGGDLRSAQNAWLRGRDEAVDVAESLIHVAKDQANRVLEPFLWHTVIVTATEWDNFFALRGHQDAALPMQRLAKSMRRVMDRSTPIELPWGAWHLPLVGIKEYTLAGLDQGFTGAEVSAGRCARSSYSNQHQPEVPNASRERWERLRQAGHWSPAEHPARVMYEDEWFDIQTRENDYRWTCICSGTDPEDDIIDSLRFRGNFRGYVQLRKHHENEAVFQDDPR